MTLQQTLSDITRALVQDERNSHFLQRLVVREVGQWQDLSTLCKDVPEEARLRAVQEAFEGDLRVAWLDASDDPDDTQYWVFLFHSKALRWSNVVIYAPELSLEEKLSDITADLLTDNGNALFLHRLFAQEPGRRQDLRLLCKDLPAEARLRKATAAFSFSGDLRVIWLDDPGSAHGPGVCTILFYSSVLDWGHVAWYNRAYFFEEIAPRLGLSNGTASAP